MLRITPLRIYSRIAPFILDRPVSDEAPAAFELRQGKERQPVRALEELADRLRVLAQRSVEVQRYKGLGEMDADELKETTMDASRRRLQQVTLEDWAEANRIFSVLMGSKVEPRREFIEKHALDVTDLDV